jgi:manganese-dependent inorganic pyrophosphatase
MNEILVIGHRNPDTDAICSALAYAEFKRRTGMPNAVAARCGDVNERIEMVLRSFGATAPKFVSDVSPKVRDVMESNVVSVLPEASVGEALRIMEERKIRVLPILTAEGVCQGLVSLLKMSRFFFPAPQRLADSRRVLSSLQNLAKTLDAKMVFALERDREEDLILMVGAMSLESFSSRIQKYPPERLVVLVGDRVDIQRLAINSRVRVVIATGGLDMDSETVELAGRNGVSLLVSPYDTATTANLARAAMMVKHVAHEHFLTFRGDESLDEAERLAAASQFQAFPVLDSHDRTVGILSKSDFLKRVERQLILVDHNELNQAVRGADRVEIIEIIDHHRIGSLTTPQPILFRNEPVGSTCTIVAEGFFRENVPLGRETAGLLLAGVASDTLNLTSPTTTERDAVVLARLEKISEVNAREFTERLFASGSLLISKPANEAVAADCKEYAEAGRTFSVAQIEELGFTQFWRRKEEILAALEGYRAGKGYFFSALLVTDVVSQSSILAVSGDPRFLDQITYPSPEPRLFELNGVVSRKKQLLPYLIHCLAQIKP